MYIVASHGIVQSEPLTCLAIGLLSNSPGSHGPEPEQRDVAPEIPVRGPVYVACTEVRAGWQRRQHRSEHERPRRDDDDERGPEPQHARAHEAHEIGPSLERKRDQKSRDREEHRDAREMRIRARQDSMQRVAGAHVAADDQEAVPEYDHERGAEAQREKIVAAAVEVLRERVPDEEPAQARSPRSRVRRAMRSCSSVWITVTSANWPGLSFCHRRCERYRRFRARRPSSARSRRRDRPRRRARSASCRPCAQGVPRRSRPGLP